MSVKVYTAQQFYGGMSTDKKLGPKASSAYFQGFDFRKSPSQLSSLPRLQREDNGIVKDLILKEAMVDSGIIYAYGNAGYFYERSTTGIWSNEAKLNIGTGGLDYRKDADAIYLTTDKSVSLFNQVSLGGTMFPDHYGPSYSTYNNSDNTGFNVAAYQAGSTSTTTLGTTIIENQNNLRYFQTDIEPLVKISVFVVSKGTGDWTLTLHDGLNDVLGVRTVTNTNLKVNQFNDFYFTAASNEQVRVYPAPNARTYHIHVTSSNGTGTISSSAVNDMSSADLEVWADRLVVTNNGLHPMIRFQQFEAIGNGNYLSIWEPISDPPTNAEWQRHRLTFPQEYEVCGLAVQNEFIVIAAEKNTTINTSTPQQGILFFWDGTSNTYNYFVEVPEGSPYGLRTYKNVAYYLAGGAWYGITSATTQPVKLRTMPGSDSEFSGIQTTIATTGTTGNPLTATLVDNFSGTGSTPDTALWDTFGTAAQANGILLLTSTTAASSSGINSHKTNYDLTDSSMQVRLIDAGNQSLTSLEVQPLIAQKDTSNQVFWYVNQNTIAAYTKIGGVNHLQASAIYTSNFEYLRIRESGGTIFWDYSQNGVTWNNLASVVAPFIVTDLLQQVSIDTYAVEASKTTCQFDDYNVPVSADFSVGYPEMMSVRRGILLVGYPSITANPVTNYGVYSWGAIDKNYPNSFGYSYVLSTGTQNVTDTNNLQLGMVTAFGDLLHVSWRDDLTSGEPRYGIDVSTNYSPPAPVSIYQTPILDSSYTAKLKSGLFIEAYYDLPDGAEITLAYSINRGNFVVSESFSTANLWQGQPGYARLTISEDNTGRFYELQGQLTVTCSGNATRPPVVYMVAIAYDDNRQEAIQ